MANATLREQQTQYKSCPQELYKYCPQELYKLNAAQLSNLSVMGN
jgi:hypothetical protein